MKELTIENAKAYDEALKTAIVAYKDEDRHLKATLERIFPELRESEDEEIKKALLELVHDTTGDELWVDYDVHKEDAIAWLKKQGEPTEINPTEFDSQLNKLLKQFEALPKEELANSLSFYLNVIQNNGTYKEEKQGEKTEPIEDFDTEFERQISHLVASAINREHEYNKGYIKWAAQSLIEYAKREIEKQGEQNPIKEYNVCDFCEDRYGCVNPCTTKLIDKQKSTDKIEPKFKVRDWIIKNDDSSINIDYSCCKITKVENGNYTIESIYGYKGYNTFEIFEKDYHLWTIQDANDGDVLAEETCTFIIKKLNPNLSAKIYCCLFNDGDFELSTILEFDYISTYPATKKQRDVLFSKMKEAGYEWDAEKKGLKKIEQKPIPKFKVGDCIYDKRDSYNRNVIREVGKDYYINAFGQKMDMTYTNANFEFLKHLEDYPIDSKPAAWSEEDMEMIDLLIAIFRISYPDGIYKANPIDTIDMKSVSSSEIIDWLKSLKDRVQPKQEWSEDDEKKRKRIMHRLSLDGTINNKDLADINDWLKSLRPQNKCTYNPYKAVVESIAEMCKHYDKATDLQDFYDNVKVKCKDAKEYDSLFSQSQWKPSEEQMKVLNKVLNFAANHESFYWNDYIFGTLNNLIRQLKKLKEG